MTLHFFRQFYAESKKLRHTKALVIPLSFLGFWLLWMLWQISSMKPEDIIVGYPMFFYHLPVMNVILLPPMISVIASRVCDMEVKGDTRKLLYTLQKQGTFFDCKYLNCFRYLLLFFFGQSALLMILGSINRFGGFRFQDLFLYLLASLTVGSVILVIQQTLSLMSENQLLPLGIGLAGSFLGLFSMFFPVSVAKLVLWGYFAVFSTVGMNWDKDTKIIDFYQIPFPTTTFILFLAFGICIFLICRTIVTQKEV